MIISKLLVQPKVKNIDTLEDLEAQPNLKVMVWENSVFHNFIEGVREGRGIVNELEPRNVAEPKERAKES